MLDWIVRNRTVYSFNFLHLQNVFTHHIFNIYVKTGFGFKWPTMFDMPENQTKSSRNQKEILKIFSFSWLLDWF